MCSNSCQRKKKFDKTHSPSASPHVEFRKAALCEPGELTQPLGLIYILSISSQEHHEQGINSSYLILPDTMHMLPATSRAFEIMQRLDFEEALPGCFDVAACDLQMGTRGCTPIPSQTNRRLPTILSVAQKYSKLPTHCERAPVRLCSHVCVCPSKWLPRRQLLDWSEN